LARPSRRLCCLWQHRRNRKAAGRELLSWRSRPQASGLRVCFGPDAREVLPKATLRRGRRPCRASLRRAKGALFHVAAQRSQRLRRRDEALASEFPTGPFGPVSEAEFTFNFLQFYLLSFSFRFDFCCLFDFHYLVYSLIIYL